MKGVCHSCGHSTPAWLDRWPDLGIFTCEECGSFSFDSEGKIDPRKLYSRDYFFDGEYKDYEGHRDSHWRNFPSVWSAVAPFLPQNPAILELGCAYGHFVEWLLERGYSQVWGMDVSDDAITAAKKKIGPRFSLVGGGDSSGPPFAPNCVVAWDVWEHLEKPVEVFRAWADRLPKGGLLAVTTVDSGSLVARLRGKRWRQVHPPTHVHYPSASALRKAVEGLGLQVAYQGHVGYSRPLEAYMGALGLDALVRPFPLIKDISIPLDLGDIQLLVAKK